MTLLAFANRFPPYLARLSARKGRGHQRMTCREIARASGLSKSLVSRISVRTTWAGYLDHCDAFCRGCGIDLFRLFRRRYAMKKSKFNFLFTDKQRRNFHSRLLSKAS